MIKQIVALATGLLITTLSVAAVINDDDQLRQEAIRVIPPLPEKMPGSAEDTKVLIELGRKLYFDKRLSINDSQSCNSCHILNGKVGGVDNNSFSKGAQGELGGRNSPTVLNAGFHLAQFWDGRAATLADQAKGPILNPVEMGMPDAKSVMEKIAKLDNYPELFKKVFVNESTANSVDVFTYDNLANAIAAFERTLITHDRFDDYLNGDNKALNAQEKQGLETFLETGCSACHNGPLLGGNNYKQLGIVELYKNQKDQGRFELTKKEADRMVFKVPTLRNIALTAPYFHDGQIEKLEDVITQMAKLQLGVSLSEQDVNNIAAFLGSLTDKARE